MHPPLDTGRPVQVQVSGPSASFGKEKEQRLIANITTRESQHLQTIKTNHHQQKTRQGRDTYASQHMNNTY
jgi:hypothetical protein